MTELKIVYLALDEINPYDRNPRNNIAGVEKVAMSIKEFGFKQPIVVDKDKNILAGHTRYLAAKKLEIEKVPVIIADDLSEVQGKSFRITDNRVAEETTWNNEFLTLEFEDLKALEFDLSLTGFNDEEIANLFVEELPPGSGEEDSVPEIAEEAISKRGDIWILGNHRLMCGDSLAITDIEKLLNNKKIDMVFTDPPYGINEPTERTIKNSVKNRIGKSKDFDAIIGDNSIETAIEVFSIADSLSDIVIYWGGNYFCHKLPDSPCWLVWDKRVEENQRDNNSDCELAYIKHPQKKSVRIFRHLWKGLMKDSERQESRVHPTQKPIALSEWCFNEYFKESKNILDFFGGSGSTLIACEKTSRNCFMMELSEKYCDVIIKRWQDYSGKKAIHEEFKKSFDEMKNKITPIT